MINFSYFHLLTGIAVLVVILLFLSRQKRGFWYLFFFALFWCYLLVVMSVIAFPIVPLPKEYWGGFKPNVNLLPFYFGRCDMPELCLRTIIENILLTIPFGFGTSFVARIQPKSFLWLAISVGFTFEITQLVISLAFRSAFRAVDINDVILNAIGTLLGYGFFRMFASLYLYITRRFEIKNKYVFAYIHDVVRQSTAY